MSTPSVFTWTALVFLAATVAGLRIHQLQHEARALAYAESYGCDYNRATGILHCPQAH